VPPAWIHVPEGDTLYRTAAALRTHLVGRTVLAARARIPGPRVERVIGSEVIAVEAHGKNLLIRLANGLELRTHLRMNGTWHRYAHGERWRRPAGRAVLVLEVADAVAVCFDAPVVELLETRAAALHPPLGGLGPDLCADAFDAAEAARRLRDPRRAGWAISEALLDQRALAGIGNVFKSEVLFSERVDPFVTVGELDDATLERLVARARALLLANRTSAVLVTTGPVGGGRAGAGLSGALLPGRLWVYGRAGLPCRRCRSPISTHRHGVLPRSTWWCPRCQAPRGSPESPQARAPGREAIDRLTGREGRDGEH
jgi:endonuclease-8